MDEVVEIYYDEVGFSYSLSLTSPSVVQTKQVTMQGCEQEKTHNDLGQL